MRKTIQFVLHIGVMLALLTSALLPAHQASAQEEPPLPAPIGDIRPTIQLSVDHGRSGDAIVASGNGVSPYPGVRVVWLDDTRSATAAVVPLQPSGSYSATLQIPPNLPAGAMRICAAVTGTPEAAFACANFTVDAPPTGSVEVMLSAEATSAFAASGAQAEATLNLYDQSGVVVASAPFNGSALTLGDVPPGEYEAAVAGRVPALLQSGRIQVEAGGQAQITLTPVPGPGCKAASVASVRLSPTAKPTTEYDFGTYVNYWPLRPPPYVTFEADLQIHTDATNVSASFDINRNEGTEAVIGQEDLPTAGATVEFTRSVGDLDVGIRTLTVTPIASLFIDGQKCETIATTRRIKMAEHPMQPNPLQHSVDRRVLDLVWDGSVYRFTTDMPQVYDSFDIGVPTFFRDGERILPAQFPAEEPNLDYIGPVRNQYTPAFRVTGTLDLDGNVTFTAVYMRSRGEMYSRTDIITDAVSLLPEDAGVPLSAALAAAGVHTADLADELRQIRFDYEPDPLFPFNQEVPVFEGILFTVAGLVTAKASISLGISGEITVRGSVRPLAPAIESTITPSVRPRLDVMLMIDALFGVASGGATAETEGELRIPTHMNSDDPRWVWMDTPCMRIKTLLYIWARINLVIVSKSWNLEPQTLLDFSEGACPQAAATTAPSPPRVLPAPAIAAGAGGRMITVYVEDTAPEAANPKMQIMARLWDAQNNQWGPPTALTTGAHAVLDPVATFIGSEGKAIVVWSENTMSVAEEEAAGNNLNAILNHQDIFFRLWNGSAWEPTQRLTNNSVPDGRAVLAGDESGAILAWVRDLDGNVATQTDWRIEVTQWNDGQNTWGAIQELNAFSSDGSNAQLSATHRNGKSLLVWRADQDGDISTNDDRQIAVAELNGQNWEISRPSALPSRADSPAAVFDPTGTSIFLAFLVRGLESNDTDVGFGNQAQLWTARRDGNGEWLAHPMMDDAGAPVRSERPQIDVSDQGEAVVVFRRFGVVGTNGELGQLAISQLMADGAGRPPLDLTDEAREHWQPVVAINGQSGQALVLNVGHTSATAAEAAAQLSPTSTRANPNLVAAALSPAHATGADAVESVTMPASADPALDPLLHFSQIHAPIGSQVTVSATVRNLGRGEATGLKVQLLAGAPGDGQQVAESDAGTLAFNEAITVSFTVERAAGEQPLFAQVSGEGGNSSQDNDLATGLLSELPAPTMVQAIANEGLGKALVVAWQPPEVADVAGYRILRRTTADGAYELVGETTEALYIDLLLTPGTAYTYTVQAFDMGGLVSQPSAEATAIAPDIPEVPQTPVFLPSIHQREN